MLVRLVQPENAEEPIPVTLLGIVTFLSPVQPLNTELPMFVMLSGIVMFVRLVQILLLVQGQSLKIRLLVTML